ncbi:hypothetical protein Ndes2437B_g01704 [Nannochloris sp. 'desiccata']
MPGTVTALDVNEEVLACFWDLAAIEGEKRAEAASKLLDHLFKSQEQYINVANPAKASTGENASAALDSAVGGCSPLVAYSIRRLHKGLTSGRKGARQGFALALTAVLGKLNCFKPENILSLVESLNDLSVGGGRDEFFGQIFGLGAIKKNPECMARVLSSSSSGSSGQLRAWLTAPCEQACPEALALALRLWQYMPKELIKACHVLPSNCTSVPSSSLFIQDGQNNSNSTTKNEKNNNNNNDQAVAAAFFSEAHLKKIQPVLRATTQGHPRLHIVWPTLVCLLLETTSSNSDDVSKIVNFWNILVETDIFQSASHERKYLGFILFGKILPNIQIELICKLLTPNLMHSLATNVSKKDSVLRPVAQQCMQQLGAAVGKANASVRAEILLAVERHGNGYLVKTLNSQKIDDMQSSDADVAARVKQLKQEFDTLVKDGESSVGRQKSVLGQLAGIAKRQQGGASVVTDILKFLVDRGLFKYGNESSDDFDLASHSSSLLISTADAVSRAQSMAQQQQQRQKKNAKDKQNSAAAAAAQDPLEIIAAYVEKRHNNQSGKSELSIAATDESTEAYKTLSNLRHSLVTLASTKDLYSEAHKQADSLKHLTILLELHAVGHPATADPTLASDLERVVGDVFPKNGGAPGPAPSAEEGDEEDEESVHWADALVDIILTIFSRNEAPLPSAPLRDAAERLFKTVASHITATGIDDLLQIVAKPLDEKEDDDEDGGGSDNSDEEMDDASGSDEEENSDDDSESEEKLFAAGEDDEDVDADADADEMTDEQMFRMDAQLGAYFATMQKGRDTKKLRQELVSFKLRALACLEMIMKKLSESSLIISMASPLLVALVSARRPSGDVGLSERLAGILRNQLPRCKPEAAADMEIEEEEELKSQLKRALYLASRNEDKAIQEAASSVFLFLEKAAFVGPKNIATEFISAAYADFFEKKKTRLGRPFFQNLLRRLPEASFASINAILDACGSARNEFIRQEAYSMLELATKSVDRDISEILKERSDTLLDVILNIVNGEFTKKQRRVEALKAICAVGQALSAKGDGLAAVLGSKGTKKLSEALAMALESNEKDVHLTRLVSFLAEDDDDAPKTEIKPSAQNIRKAAAGAGAGPGKKRSASTATAPPARAAKRK